MAMLASAQAQDILVAPQTATNLSVEDEQAMARLRAVYGEDNVVLARVRSPYDVGAARGSTLVGVDMGANRRFNARLSQTIPSDGGPETWALRGPGMSVPELNVRTVSADDDGGVPAFTLAGSIISGDDMVRAIPLNNRGDLAFATVRGVARFADHPTGEPLPTGSLLEADRCSHPDNEIRIGWAIGDEALASYDGNMATLEDAMNDGLVALNTALEKMDSPIRATAIPLSAGTLTWTAPTDLGRSLRILTGRADARALAIWELADDADVDIVVLIAPRADSALAPSACGFAQPYARPQAAAAVVNHQCLASPRHTLSHEIAHVLGACHEPERHGAGSICQPTLHGIPTYRYGWRDPESSSGTIEVEWGSTDHDVLKGFTRLPRFSLASSDDKAGERRTRDVTAIVRDRAPIVSGFSRCRQQSM